MLLLSSNVLALLCDLHVKPNPPLYTLNYYLYHYLFIFWKNLRNRVFVMWWQRQTTRKALQVTEMDAWANGTNALHMTLYPASVRTVCMAFQTAEDTLAFDDIWRARRSSSLPPIPEAKSPTFLGENIIVTQLGTSGLYHHPLNYISPIYTP